MKCRVCRGPAVLDLPQHNANFCPDHFLKFCRDQVAKAVADHEMFDAGDRLLVAVSGGKDSLAVWDILTDLGYATDGLCIHLGIGDYSESSARFARDFAAARGLHLHEVDLATEHGMTVPEAARATRRVPCSACGTSKRHIFDRVAIEGGYDALVTGHNLDDEAAVLFGNVIRWQTDYIARQHPVLAARDGFPRKVKPLIRLGEREMAAYCVIRGIDYIVDECPMAVGNSHLGFKELLNTLEAESPGTKHDFYHGFLRRVSERFAGDDHGGEGPDACVRCGAPTSAEICAFCRIVAKVADRRDRDAAVSPRPAANRAAP